MLNICERYRLSEVFSVDELVAGTEDSVASVSHFILLSNVAHIKELFVVENEELSCSVDVSEHSNGYKRPPDKFLEHEHSSHTSSGTSSKGVA